MTTEATENKCSRFYNHAASFFHLQKPVDKMAVIMLMLGAAAVGGLPLLAGVSRSSIYTKGCNEELARVLNNATTEEPNGCNKAKDFIEHGLPAIGMVLLIAILPALFISTYHFARLISCKIDCRKFLGIATAFFTMAISLAFHLAGPIVMLLNLYPENQYECGRKEGYSMGLGRDEWRGTRPLPTECKGIDINPLFGIAIFTIALAFCDVLVGAITGIVMRCVNNDGERQPLITTATNQL